MWILFLSFLFCILWVSFSFNFPLFYQISLFQFCFSFPGALSCSLFFTLSSFTSLSLFVLGFFFPLHYLFPFFFFFWSCWFLSFVFPLVTDTHWLSVTVKEWSVYMCVCGGSLEGDRVGTRPLFSEGAQMSLTPGFYVLNLLAFFGGVLVIFPWEQFSCHLSLSQDKSSVLGVLSRKEAGGPRTPTSCPVLSTTHPYTLLCLLSQVWGSAQVVSLKHVVPSTWVEKRWSPGPVVCINCCP